MQRTIYVFIFLCFFRGLEVFAGTTAALDPCPLLVSEVRERAILKGLSGTLFAQFNELDRIFQNVNRISSLIPPGTDGPYRFLFRRSANGNLWRKRLFLAALFHGTLVEARDEHPEMAFTMSSTLGTAIRSAGDSVVEYFVPLFSPREMAIAGLIALLHSKTTIPGPRLADWKNILTQRSDCSECRISWKQLETPAARNAFAALGEINDAETEGIRRSAEVLRIADINRYRGPNVPGKPRIRNHTKYPFRIDRDGKVYFLDTDREARIYPPDSEQIELYGHVAMGTPRFVRAPAGLLIRFPIYHWEGEVIAKLRVETNQSNFWDWAETKGTRANWPRRLRDTSWRAESLGKRLMDILSDYPSEMVKEARIFFDPEPIP